MLDCREAHQSLGFHAALFTEVVVTQRLCYSRYIYAPVHDILAFIAYASTKRSDETAHLHSLDRTLAARTKTKGYI